MGWPQAVMSEAANLHAGSWRGAIAKRMVLMLILATLAIFGGVAAIFIATNHSVGEYQLDDAAGHFAVRVTAVEHSWLIQAEAFRSQLEFSRVLEGTDERLRQARLVAYATSFGGQGTFTHVVVLGADGRVKHRYRTQSQQDLDLPAPADKPMAWVFGERDGLLYRAISVPIRIDQESGRLLLYAPVDNALLGSNVYPNTEVSLLWQGHRIAQSPQLTTEAGKGKLMQLRDSRVRRVVAWDSADGGGPAIAIERIVSLPLSLVDVLLIVFAAGAVIAALGWIAMGHWLTAQSRRITALEHAASAFALAPQMTPEMSGELDSVRDASGDEVSRLAQALVGMMRDIEQSLTERSRVESELVASQALLTNLVLQMPGVIYQYCLYPDGSSNFPFASPGLWDIYEVTPEQAKADVSELFSRLHPDDLPLVAAGIAESAQTLAPWNQEYRVNLPVQGLRWRQGYARPEQLADGRVLWHGFITDITGRKKIESELELHRLHLEELVVERTATLLQRNEELNKTRDQLLQSEKLASLGGLVAGVSHELNTPMGNALTTASALQYKVKRFAQESSSGLRRSQLEAFMAHCAEAADLIVRNISKAATLVSSFKRIAVDQTGEQRCTFSLADVVEETLRAVSPTFKNAQVHIQADIPRELDLDSFPGAIEQVLTNLVQNAVIHAHDGVRPLQIAIQARSAEGHNLQLVISDDGRGMDPETAKRAFDPYFTTRFGQGGSGLGLYIVHNVVTGTLGGSVSLDSAKGKGAVFTVLIPLVAPQAMSQMQAKPLEG